jgi:3-deoxy-D-manno-octulosonic-acid transferase
MAARRSLVLAAYLAWSERAAGYAERRLAERAAAGKEDRARLDERRGLPSAERPEGQLIWFHAASVGEGVSLLELIRRMGEERPDLSFLLTSGTVTSAEILAGRLPPRTIHQFVPLDVRPWIRRFLDHWRPDLVALAEAELWPGLLYEAGRRGLAVALINARMTEAAHRRWRRWALGAARRMVAGIAHVQAQDEATAARLRDLGLPPERLEVTGTLKEGSKALPHDEAERVALAAALAGRPCWLAASTHEGEEAGAAEAHAQARRTWPSLLLIVAPRHPERADAIAEGLRLDGWRLARRSAGEMIAQDTDIYLADTIGEMGLWYRLCPVSFVGGSLVEVGGHNPFEPAALGSAILHGPSVANFADIYDRLAAAGAARAVSDWDELGTALARTLEPDEAARLAHAAWGVVSEGADVTEAAMDLLFAMLDGVD